MGSHNGVWFWGRSKQASIMKFVLMSLVLVQTCLGMDMMLQKIVKQTEKHVLENSCFGPGNKQKFDLAIGESIEKCLQLAPTNDLLNVLSPNSQFSSLFPAVNVRNPFKQFQTYQDLDQLVSLWRNKRSVTKETQRDCSVLMKMTSWSPLTT